MAEVNGNGGGFWKTIALLMLGAVIPLCGGWVSATRDTVTRSEVPVIFKEYTDEIGGLREQNARLEAQITQLQIDVAIMSAKLGVPARTSGGTH